jgi:hypothetical protein
MHSVQQSQEPRKIIRPGFLQALYFKNQLIVA